MLKPAYPLLCFVFAATLSLTGHAQQQPDPQEQLSTAQGIVAAIDVMFKDATKATEGGCKDGMTPSCAKLKKGLKDLSAQRTIAKVALSKLEHATKEGDESGAEHLVELVVEARIISRNIMQSSITPAAQGPGIATTGGSAVVADDEGDVVKDTRPPSSGTAPYQPRDAVHKEVRQVQSPQDSSKKSWIRHLPPPQLQH